jgi:hypothetical protein
MTHPLPWKPIAIVTSLSTILLSLLLLPACCCVRGTGPQAGLPPIVHIPPIGTEPIPTPKEAESKAPTDGEMHNVDFHLDEQLFLRIHHLRGVLVSKQPGAPLNFDDKTSFVMKVDTGEVGMLPASLDRLMNSYVFNYPNPPLRDLKITIEGKQLVQSGIIHKIVDIPFTMWADVSATNGKIRIHPTKMSICGINGLGLLKAVGMTVEKMLQLPKERGVSAEGNDMLLDPQKLLPPPQIELKLVGVQIRGQELVQIFDAGQHLAPIVPRHPDEKNWMYYRHGTLRMGKLLMVDADMQVTDCDPSDPFDFYIDRYNDQLVAGFSRNQPNYALFVYMRDFNHLGEPPRPGERLAP